MAITLSQHLGQQSRPRAERRNVVDLALKAVSDLRSRLARLATPARAVNRGSFGVAIEVRSGRAYNEEAFRHFLEIEQKRSARSGRPLVLVLVDVDSSSETSGSVDEGFATKVFSALWLSLRETDFMGWFRHGHIVGAVLTQRADVRDTTLLAGIEQRVSNALRQELPSNLHRRIDVRVHQFPCIVRGRD